MRSGALVLAGAAAVLAGGLAAVTLAAGVADFFDPCRAWAESDGSRSGSDGSRSSLPATPPGCGRASATSETRMGAAAGLTLIQGGILAAVALGLAGAWRSKPLWLALGSVLLFAESVPLSLGSFVLATFPSALLLACAAFLALGDRAAPRPA